VPGTEGVAAGARDASHFPLQRRKNCSIWPLTEAVVELPVTNPFCYAASESLARPLNIYGNF